MQIMQHHFCHHSGQGIAVGKPGIVCLKMLSISRTCSAVATAWATALKGNQLPMLLPSQTVQTTAKSGGITKVFKVEQQT